MDKIPVYVFAKWQVKEGNLATLFPLLTEVAKKSREEKGNLLYKLHQSANDANTILIYEGYVDEVAAEEHRNSAHFQEIVVKSIIPLLENREVIKARSIID